MLIDCNMLLWLLTLLLLVSVQSKIGPHRRRTLRHFHTFKGNMGLPKLSGGAVSSGRNLGNSVGGGDFNGGGRDAGNLSGSDEGDGGRKGRAGQQHAVGLLALTSLLDSYSELLETAPYQTKMISSAVIGVVADFITQQMELRRSDHKKALDYRRLLVFAMVTGFYTAPIVHIWFNYLASAPFIVAIDNPVAKAIAMVALDQTLGATLITAGLFIAFEAVRLRYYIIKIHESYTSIAY
jgi:hypothetical protein